MDVQKELDINTRELVITIRLSLDDLLPAKKAVKSKRDDIWSNKPTVHSIMAGDLTEMLL